MGTLDACVCDISYDVRSRLGGKSPSEVPKDATAQMADTATAHTALIKERLILRTWDQMRWRAPSRAVQEPSKRAVWSPGLCACRLAMLEGLSQLAGSQSWWQGWLGKLGLSRWKHRVDSLLLRACLLKLNESTPCSRQLGPQTAVEPSSHIQHTSKGL